MCEKYFRTTHEPCVQKNFRKHNTYITQKKFPVHRGIGNLQKRDVKDFGRYLFLSCTPVLLICTQTYNTRIQRFIKDFGGSLKTFCRIGTEILRLKKS